MAEVPSPGEQAAEQRDYLVNKDRALMFMQKKGISSDRLNLILEAADSLYRTDEHQKFARQEELGAEMRANEPYDPASNWMNRAEGDWQGSTSGKEDATDAIYQHLEEAMSALSPAETRIAKTLADEYRFSMYSSRRKTTEE